MIDEASIPFPTVGELGSHYLELDTIPWVSGGNPGISQKLLMEDKARGMRTALIRWEPGASLPLHEHQDIEQSYILEGSLCDHEGECNAGDYVWRPAGSRHRAWSPNGCLLLGIFYAPNIILEGARAGKPSW